LEQALDSISEELTSEMLDSAKKSFLDGYKMEFVLTEETVALFPLMRRFVDLYKYARLIRCLADEFDEEPDWMVWLRNKLNSVIADIETKISQNHEQKS
jgi:Ser/Thr protein kinase RdoA (MazF antagonist)